LFGGAGARAAVGDAVPFVLWFNFLSGFVYVLAGVGLFLWVRWGAQLSALLAIAILLVFAAFGLHVVSGGAFEMRTVGAMILRSAFGSLSRFQPAAHLVVSGPRQVHSNSDEPENEMSHLLDRLTFFRRTPETFSDGHGITTHEDRRWEDGYRKRWQHDKIVRSTHGVNCTGSCSWKIYVKGGIVTWETQQTDYPRTRPDLPNHEPRGCSRGASYSWYLYSGNRVKYPLVRSRLLKLWREARALRTPVAAWASIVEDPGKRAAYVTKRGLGGFVRAHWDEVNEIIAAANAYTAKTHGPDRVIGFSPIPAMSMVSYAAGSRYLSLLGGVCMSFYDWYCDLPPSSHRPGASRPTFRKAPTGTIPAFC
jgi:hypothetical protein